MASDRYNYVLTESAEADIDEAFDYIASDLVNPDAASAFADELEEKLEEIGKESSKSGAQNQGLVSNLQAPDFVLSL